MNIHAQQQPKQLQQAAAHQVRNNATSQFKNNRPEVQQQQSIQRMVNEAQGEVVQYALPHGGLADTKGYYKSVNGAKNKPYKGGRPSNFSTKFKVSMVKHQWGGSYNKNTDLWHVQSVGPSGVVLPTNAIQIDHTIPWASIEKKLKEDPSKKLSGSFLNKAKKEGYVLPSGKQYSMYAARMYYHDADNLKPWAGSENASKGKNMDSIDVDAHEGLRNRAARSAGVHHEFLQAANEAYREWGEYPQDKQQIMDYMDDVDFKMIDVAGSLGAM